MAKLLMWPICKSEESLERFAREWGVSPEFAWLQAPDVPDHRAGDDATVVTSE